ncbi:Cell morphogenesis protein PAG1 [Ceratocystis fimbriata CBS 114723]|uniref:Cell morphogenesis protein PAG1 n=1 Tax=Ceratocystis fimbriata CBS 114723 TaxID=1035309 RepID=A0A2C5XEC7_9PEZI|nr:Cell morphogenesis protein PAG1 [Ceratocystis fimbriata CBS 114723]
MAPSQTPPDPLSEPPKLSSLHTPDPPGLDEHGEEWNRTLRPDQILSVRQALAAHQTDPIVAFESPSSTAGYSSAPISAAAINTTTGLGHSAAAASDGLPPSLQSSFLPASRPLPLSQNSSGKKTQAATTLASVINNHPSAHHVQGLSQAQHHLEQQKQQQPPFGHRTSPTASISHSRQSSQSQEQEQYNPLSHSHSHSSGRSVDHTLTRTNATYGHHRQTSIVHGIQHSRNGSHASLSSSPLSPQMIAAAGAALIADRMEAESQSRPATAQSGSLATTATLNGTPGTPTEPTFGGGLPQTRKPERNPSTKSRHENAYNQPHSNTHSHSHSHSRSGSRHNGHSLKPSVQDPMSEYALHVLYTSFIQQAEDKLNACATAANDPEPIIDHICGPGVDPAFDYAIRALGHMAAPRPKPLIDFMMIWRKNKSDAANEARAYLQQARGVPNIPGFQRRNTEPAQHMFAALNDEHHPTPPRYEFIAQADRRATVSIYILCRVLLEIVNQSDLEQITIETEGKLEGIIFGQLKIAEPEQLLASPLKMANWNIFALLLGQMSNINFKSVTDRYLNDLERLLKDAAVKGPNSVACREIEGKIELVLWGMKYLKVSLSNHDRYELSCDFLIRLGKLFKEAHGQRVKTAFCQVLDLILRPIAATANMTDFGHSRWIEVIGSFGPRLNQMLPKPRHWSSAFPLAATMLCVSPMETFNSQWLQLVLPLQPKFKDRYTKSIALQVISRLVWTYLYRCVDSPVNIQRKLDEAVKLVLAPAKRSIVASDKLLSEPFILLLRIIGYKFPEYCCRSIIFPLISADLFMSKKDIKIENLDPDRIVVGIKAFLAIMSDLEKGEAGRPEFPPYYPPPSHVDKTPSSPTVNFSAAVSGSLYSQPSQAQTVQEVIISEPLDISRFSDKVREVHVRFCAVLGEIALLCDNTFGGQATLDEKFNSPGPKTPVSDTFNFTRRDDHINPGEQKQAFYELFHVGVQALPRCLSANIPFNRLISLLCTGTAHVQSSIAESAAISLKAIARQGHAQQVTMGFSRFIFNFDGRYSTMSDGGMLGPGHIENTLQLYVELLRIWIEEIERKTKDAIAADELDPNSPSPPELRAIKLDLSSVWAEVEVVESHGLFFLCSQSRRVRHFAITVLTLITEFDAALGKEKSQEGDFRLISILEKHSEDIMKLDDDRLTVFERSRIQRGKQSDSSSNALIELCTSDVHYDTALWIKVFPNLIRISYETCPFTVTLCRDLVCNRIVQIYPAITEMSEPLRVPHSGTDPSSARQQSARGVKGLNDGLVDQWKLFLMFACTTMTDTESAPPSASLPVHQHSRKGSASKSSSQEMLFTGRNFLKLLLPLLSATSDKIRESVVVSIGSININLYRCLLEVLEKSVLQCNEDARARMHQRSARRNQKTDILRTSITHIYRLTAHFLRNPEVHKDETVFQNLIAFTKELKLFLMDEEVQMDWEFHTLRQHYCGLMEELFEGISGTADPSRWMTFEARKSAFLLMEDWCGFSPNQQQIRAREDTMRQSIISKKSAGERGNITSAMEIEKRNLRTAALNAMASLCAGPIGITTEGGAVLQFDPRRLVAWIESVFNSGSDRMNSIGRRALRNLVSHNAEFPSLLEHCISRCYLIDNVKGLESYFNVVTEVLLEKPEYPVIGYKVLMLCLFTLGHEQAAIRTNSVKVLQALNEREPGHSFKIQDFNISISDKTPIVYKHAQLEISKRLSRQHADIAFHVFSEFSMFYKDLQPAAQRSLVGTIIPWLQTVELLDDANGSPSAQAYMVLANLLEITIKAGDSLLNNEVKALWLALITGSHVSNVRIILDFVIALCLERGEQNFVQYVKQIVAFLAAGSGPDINVVEFLVLQMTPKAMVPTEKKTSSVSASVAAVAVATAPPPEVSAFSYCADLSEVLPVGTKQAGFSLGQLSLILLVDLMISGVKVAAEHIPLLLQVVMVLWDHYTPMVQEQAQCMLVHMIHELVICRGYLGGEDETSRAEMEDLIDKIRSLDQSVIWTYEDKNGNGRNGDHSLPTSMESLTSCVVQIFELTYPGVKEAWGRLSLTWATSCPVRHLACRSFQIFRCIFTSLDQFMLADMLARLSNTAADDDAEIQTFSMEILVTLTTLITKLDGDRLLALPQLFWTMCACLESVNELEFIEAVTILEQYLCKLDFSSPTVQQILMEGQPPKWDGPFQGLQPLVYKGLRSSSSIDLTLRILDRLTQLPSNTLIGDDSRLFLSILANWPRFLHELELPLEQRAPQVMDTARIMIKVADIEGHISISAALNAYVAGSFPTSHDFLMELYSGLREAFLPRYEFQMVVMMMGFLTNAIPWVKLKTVDILCVVLAEVDLHKPELAGHGSDLVSPVLRLLQTEYCMHALRVIDNTMAMYASPMDKQHLRMSMMRTNHREFSRVQSLFGIPDANGWAIPMPGRKADATRANIHAVFYVCQNAADGTSHVSPPVRDASEVAFHADDYSYGFFSPPPDRTTTMVSDDIAGTSAVASSMVGDLVTKLDSLDDFFDDLEQSPPSEGRLSSRTVTEFSPEVFESGAQLYDEHVLPMLHEASTTASSFQNGFADRHMQPNNTMNPGAFVARPGTSSGVVNSSGHGTGLGLSLSPAGSTTGNIAAHSRSVTSPSAPIGQPSSFFMPIHGAGLEEEGRGFAEADEERPTPFFKKPEGPYFADNSTWGLNLPGSSHTQPQVQSQTQTPPQGHTMYSPASPISSNGNAYLMGGQQQQLSLGNSGLTSQHQPSRSDVIRRIHNASSSRDILDWRDGIRSPPPSTSMHAPKLSASTNMFPPKGAAGITPNPSTANMPHNNQTNALQNMGTSSGMGMGEML